MLVTGIQVRHPFGKPPRAIARVGAEPEHLVKRGIALHDASLCVVHRHPLGHGGEEGLESTCLLGQARFGMLELRDVVEDQHVPIDDSWSATE